MTASNTTQHQIQRGGAGFNRAKLPANDKTNTQAGINTPKQAERP